MGIVLGLLVESRNSLLGSKVEVGADNHDYQLQKILCLLIGLKNLQLLEV